MGRAFFFASGVGLALCVVFPSLLPFVVVGIVVGLLPQLLHLARRLEAPPGNSYRRNTGVWIAVTVALLIAVAFISARVVLLIPSAPFEGGGEEEGGVHRLIAVPVTYSGRGTYHDDPERLVIVDRLSVSLDDLELVTKRYRRLHYMEGVVGHRTFPELEKILIAQLTRAGWRLALQTTSADTFSKGRRVSLHSHVVRVDTGNEIPLPHLPSTRQGGIVLLSLYFTKRSQMALIAPTRTFDSTRPASDREEHLVADVEERRVPIEGMEALEVDVRSPWLRSGLMSTIADGIASGAKNLIGTLIGALIAFLSKPVNEWAKKRLKIRQKKKRKKKKGSRKR